MQIAGTLILLYFIEITTTYGIINMDQKITMVKVWAVVILFFFQIATVPKSTSLNNRQCDSSGCNLVELCWDLSAILILCCDWRHMSFSRAQSWLMRPTGQVSQTKLIIKRLNSSNEMNLTNINEVRFNHLYLKFYWHRCVFWILIDTQKPHRHLMCSVVLWAFI